MRIFTSILWNVFLIIIIATMIISVIFSPIITSLFAWVVIVTGIGIALIFTITRFIREYRLKIIDRFTLVCNIVMEISAIITGIAIAMFVAYHIEKILIQWIFNLINVNRLGWENNAIVLIGLIIGLTTGLVIGVLIQRIFNYLIVHNSKITITLVMNRK